MNKFNQIGKVTPHKMRLKKLEEILGQTNRTINDAKFFVDLLSSLCADYAGHFHGYTDEMFLKLLSDIKYLKMNSGSVLYESGHKCTDFFIVLDGRIEIFTSQDESKKMIRSVDMGMIFGKRDVNSERQDVAVAANETIVLTIDRIIYDRVRAETVQNDAEKKVNFLVRYVPRLRMSPRSIIEELDILFVKECYTRGYRILKEGEFNEHIYFVKQGLCQVLQPINSVLSALKAQLTPEERTKYKYLCLSLVGVGQCFGEDSGLNGVKVQETVQAESDLVEVYKINKSMLLQYFGGSASEVVYSIRASLQAKKNWNQLKIMRCNSMAKEELISKGFLIDDEEYKEMKATKTVPGEVPYLKMIQTYGKPSLEMVTRLTREEEKKAETAVLPPPKPELKPRPRNEFMVPKAPNEEYRNDTLKGFGTTRLVASSDRLKNLTSQQMRGLVTLRSMAQEVKTGGKKTDQKGGFDKSSLKKFQESVMLADPAIVEKTNNQDNSGLNLFNKMRNFNAENLKEKLGQQ